MLYSINIDTLVSSQQPRLCIRVPGKTLIYQYYSLTKCIQEFSSKEITTLVSKAEDLLNGSAPVNESNINLMILTTFLLHTKNINDGEKDRLAKYLNYIICILTSEPKFRSGIISLDLEL